MLAPVTTGNVRDFDQLYALASAVRWEHLVGVRQTFAVRASVTDGPFTDRHFAALRVKDAVVDQFRKRLQAYESGADEYLLRRIARTRELIDDYEAAPVDEKPDEEARGCPTISRSSIPSTSQMRAGRIEPRTGS